MLEPAASLGAHLTNPPGAHGPDLGTSWMFYLRLAFDARYHPG